MSARPGVHRARPRYGRLSVLAASVTVTAVAVLASWGVFPDDEAEADTTSSTGASSGRSPSAAPSSPAGGAGSTETPARAGGASADQARALPADSGSGRRVVFSQSDQQVWLVSGDESVRRTYPVSGSTLDNLDPGTYEVYSRSEQAWGIEDSGTMEWFVRFTRGPSGAAIGFHTIPEKNGRRLQTVGQLGTPRSHGCIRQRDPDARALWRFAPLGTTVVVV